MIKKARGTYFPEEVRKHINDEQESNDPQLLWTDVKTTAHIFYLAEALQMDDSTAASCWLSSFQPSAS